MSNPNGLYRRVDNYDYFTKWQCLSCKGFFIKDDEAVVDYHYCPTCGVKLDILWTTRNKRIYPTKWNQYLPIIEFSYIETIAQEIAKDGFYVVNLSKPYFKKTKITCLGPHEFFHFLWGDYSRNDVKDKIHWMINKYSKDIFVTIKRWDGTTKEAKLNELLPSYQ